MTRFCRPLRMNHRLRVQFWKRIITSWEFFINYPLVETLKLSKKINLKLSRADWPGFARRYAGLQRCLERRTAQLFYAHWSPCTFLFEKVRRYSLLPPCRNNRCGLYAVLPTPFFFSQILRVWWLLLCLPFSDRSRLTVAIELPRLR